MEKQSKFLNFKRKLMKMFLKTVFKVKDGTKNALLEAKSVSTNKNFILGFRRISLGVVIMLLSFTLLAIFGCLPKASAAANLIQQQSDFKTFDSCWYSLTPSTTAMTSATVNNGYTKYCYSLVNDDTNLDTSSYQYIINENDEVYVFEYYTWVENNANDTQKMAVYSETGLKETQINGQTMYVLSSGSNNYAFEKIDDYMYYRLYRFLPDWKNSGKIYYSQEEKTFSDNEYYGYKLLNDDIYKVYKDLNVSTEYVFDIESENVVFYQNVTIDPDTGDYLYNSTDGTVDTSEKQVINRNDINQATYVVEKMGNAYDVKDSNGKEKGQDGFSTNMYYKGNFLYIYKQGIKTGDTTVDAFEIYKIISDDYTEIDEDKFNINSGYSLITFKNDTKETIAEAVRYYNLYEISYKIVQTSDGGVPFNNSTNDAITEQTNANSVVAKDNNGNPTGYKIQYTYNIELKNSYAYEITYELQNFLYREYQKDTGTAYQYSLEKTQSCVELSTLNNLIDKSKFDNATTLNDLEKFSNNQQFYAQVDSYQSYSNVGSYDSKQETPNYSEKKTVTSYEYNSEGSEIVYSNSKATQNSNLITYSVDKNGIVTAKSNPAYYCYNNFYYTNQKQTYKQTVTEIEAQKCTSDTSYILNYSAANDVTVNSSNWKNTIFGYSFDITPSQKSSGYDFYVGGTNLKSYYNSDIKSNSLTTLSDFITFGYDERDGLFVYNRCNENTLYKKTSPGDPKYGVKNTTTITLGAKPSSYYSGTVKSPSFSNYFNSNDNAVLELWYAGALEKRIHLNDTARRVEIFSNFSNIYAYDVKVRIPVYYSNKATSFCMPEENKTASEAGILIYNINFINFGADDVHNSYYEFKETNSSSTDGNASSINVSELTFSLDSGKTSGKFISSTIQYQLYGTKYSLTEKYVAYTVGKQKSASDNTVILNRQTTYFKVTTTFAENGTIGINDSAPSITLTSAEIAELKKEILNYAENLGNVTIQDNNISVSANGYIEFFYQFNEKYAIYYDDTNTACFTDTASTDNWVKAKIDLITVSNPVYHYFYDVYTMNVRSTSINQGNFISEAKESSTVDLTKNSIPNNEDYSCVNGVKYLNVYTRETYNVITGSKSTGSTVTYYSNSKDTANNSGTKYLAYDSSGKATELNIFNKETADGQSQYYIAQSAKENKTVAVTIKDKIYTTNDIRSDSNDHSKDPNYKDKEYYKSIVEKEVGYEPSDSDYLTIDIKCEVIEYYYSGTITTYTAKKVAKEKVIFNYDASGNTSSKNFGSSDVKVSSYYSNITYDKDGKMTKGTWNSSEPTLPTSYNLFDDASFYENLNNDKKIKKTVYSEDNINYCTLYNSITINLQNAIEKDLKRLMKLGIINEKTYKTYYLSYYIDNIKYSKIISTSYNNLVNLAEILVGSSTSTGYTLSRIMLSDDASREYSQYVEIGVENYNEKKIAHKIQNDIAWYKTNETYTAYISNLDELISKNGDWNNNADVKYTVNTGDRNYIFTYTNSEKKHTTDNEYYFGDKTSRLVWNKANNNFAYILNRKINVVLGKEYGNDYLNTTKNKDWNGINYYGKQVDKQETVTNNKHAIKKYDSEDYGECSYISNSSIVGKLALLKAANYNINNVYVNIIENTGEFELVEVSEEINYAYEVYYDNNKSTEDDGYTFTYNNSGFEMTDAISYELKKDENGNPVKDSNGNYVYDEIKRNSLVINTDGTLDNLVNSGLSKYIGSSVKTPSKSTPTIRDNNIVKHLYEKGTNLTIDGSIVDNTGANTNETDVNTNIDYNNYEYSSSVYQEISKSYEKDYKNYLMFLNSTVDYNQTYNNYTNAFYKDSNGNIYRLKNENSVIKSDYSSINSISRYKKYEISGRWVKADSLNVGNSAIQGSSFKPKSTDISYSNFLSAEYNISKNYGAYLGVVKTKDGTSAYEGKLIGQNIAMGAVSTENSLNTSYYFDYYTVKDNNVQITNNGITGNYLNSSYYSDLMLEKNQNYYHDDSLNEDIFCNRLLVKKEKVKLYSITKKIEYNLQYVVEEANVDKLATLDMRYQYQSSNFFTQLKNSQLPIYIKGDDLSSHFEVTGARYSVNYDLKTYIIANSSVNIYNMAVASTKEQGILKPGITTIDNTQYIETIAYRGGVYKLGNIIGNESMFIDFAKYAENLKTKIADAIWNADSKDILELIKTLQKVEEMNLFTSTLYSVSINLNGLLSLGNDIWRLVSSYDKLKNSIVIEENGTTLSNLTKNSDYIRIGKACYYRVSTTDKYWSYRGVDVTLQNEDASNFDASGQYFKSLFTKVNPNGFVNILGSVYSSYFSSGLNLNSESKHQLAYATYSPLITSNHYVTGKDKEARNYISEVYLADILNGLDGADKVNQYFVQVEIGLTNSDTYIIYDLPLADVDMSYVTESFKSAKHKSARGIRFYNLSASKDGLRFLPSDDPGYFINTTAHGWQDYLLSCNVTNPDNMKIAYGYALSNSGKPIVEQQSTIDTSELKSLNINAGEKGSTYAALSDNPDNLYSKLGQNYISEHNLNSITSDTSNYMYVSNNGVPGDSLVNTITTLKDKSSGNGTSTLSVVQKPNNKEESYYVLNYTQYKTEMVLFGDYDKWLGNVEQYVVDALKITKHTIKAVFKFLTGKKEEAKDEYSNANSTNHLVMQFYQLPTFSEEIDASSKTTLSFDSEANNRGTDDVCSPIVDYNNYSYVLSDNNPTSNTSFNFKLSHEVLLNPSYNVYVGYTWGFALWTDDYIEGWQLKNGKYYYVNADRLGSGSYSGVDIVNIMLQTELNASVAFELPEGHTYHFKVYDGDAINNKKSGSNYFYTESALGNKHEDEIIISTSYNAVHNPYGQNKDKIDVSYSFYSGDAYLHDNDLITYDMLKFIYNTENVKTASYNNLGYVDYYDPILKQTFKFSSKVLMQKNLNTENISKIAFKLTGTNGYKQNISYNNYVEYRLYDIATREVVAEGKLNNNTSYLNNIILYDLTELDKAAISKYGGINESFVNNYLLKDKLVFSIRNTKDSEWLDADCKFTISWKPYYEETMTYLDLNQNRTYDDNEIETSYNVDTIPISKESQTYVYAEYEHILSATNWVKTLYTVTNNNQSSAVEDLVPFKVEDNWYQLCAYRNGEAHIIK